MEEQPKRPKGRPRVADPASVRINLRVTPGERDKYKRAADRDKAPTLTAWVKGLMDRQAE